MTSAENEDYKFNGQIYAEFLTQINCAKASLSQEAQDKSLALEQIIEREIIVFKKDFSKDYAKVIDIRNLLQKQEENREKKEREMLEEYGLQKFDLVDKQNELQEQYEKKLHGLEKTNAGIRDKISREVEKLTEMISSQKEEFKRHANWTVQWSIDQNIKQEAGIIELIKIISSQKEEFEHQLAKQAVEQKTEKKRLWNIIATRKGEFEYQLTEQAIKHKTELARLTEMINSQSKKFEHQLTGQEIRLTEFITNIKKLGETSGNGLMKIIKSIQDRLEKFNKKGYFITTGSPFTGEHRVRLLID
jgi:hypothetical protein